MAGRTTLCVRAALAGGTALLVLSSLLLAQAPVADYSTAPEVAADFTNGRLEGLEPIQLEDYYGYVEDELGGQRCIRTDSASGKHRLNFRVGPGFAQTPDLPLTALVEYYDHPAGLLALFYQAAAGPGTHWTQAFRTMRTGEPRWVQVCIPLPHCCLGGEPPPWRQIGLTGFTNSGDPRAADVAVASIRLLRAHMTVEPELLAVPANGTAADRTATIIATVRTSDKTPPPDGTPVAFEVEPLGLEGAATTVNGEAAWQFVPEPTPRRLQVTARWGDIEAETSLWVQPTDRPLVETEVPLADFEAGERLRLTPTAAEGTTARFDTETVREGASSLRIDFHWDDVETPQGCLRLDINRPLPGVPKEIGFEVHGEGVGNSLCFSVVDAQQETFAYIVGDMYHKGWETFICPLTEAAADDIYGPNGNRQFDLPLAFQNIRLMRNDDRLQGTLYLDYVRAICLVPEERQ